MLKRYRALNAGEVRGALPTVLSGRGIPKVLYQTHSTGMLPDRIALSREKLQSLNPGWKLKYYDDNECSHFIRTEYGERILRYYESISENYGAARADLFRYLLIYKCGGVYLDIKSSATIPFDTIIKADDRYLLAGWDLNDAQAQSWGHHPELKAAGSPEYQQWHIIAEPGHPYLKHVIERVLYNLDHYIPEIHGTGAYGVLRLTGPIAYSLAISELRSCNQDRFTGSSNDLGLIYSIYSDVKRHRTALGMHYSTRNDSICKVDTRRRTIGAGYRLGRKVYRAFVKR